MPPMGNAGQRIKAARCGLNLTIAQLAEAAGLSPTTIGRVESGGANVRQSTINQIWAALEMRGVRTWAAGISFHSWGAE